jgi:hypothetical protein
MNGDLYEPGDTPLFEYHCNESHDSPDAPVWYRSHQRVTVLKLNSDDDTPNLLAEFPTLRERGEAGAVLTYRVRFADGLEWDVFEDELTETTDHYSRPDPPRATP